MPPSHLPLHEQLTYTDGFCEAFANALIWTFGADLRICRLVVTDPRYAETLDYPADARIEAHVFCVDEAGWAIDAEGRRPITEMLRSFGVRRGYKHEIQETDHQINMDAPLMRGAESRRAFERATKLVKAHGWGSRSIPRADGSLSRNFDMARAEQHAFASLPES